MGSKLNQFSVAILIVCLVLVPFIFVGEQGALYFGFAFYVCALCIFFLSCIGAVIETISYKRVDVIGPFSLPACAIIAFILELCFIQYSAHLGRKLHAELQVSPFKTGQYIDLPTYPVPFNCFNPRWEVYPPLSAGLELTDSGKLQGILQRGITKVQQHNVTLSCQLMGGVLSAQRVVCDPLILIPSVTSFETTAPHLGEQSEEALVDEGNVQPGKPLQSSRRKGAEILDKRVQYQVRWDDDGNDNNNNNNNGHDEDKRSRVMWESEESLESVCKAFSAYKQAEERERKREREREREREEIPSIKIRNNKQHTASGTATDEL